ncbi:MAG: hypothetical protein PHR35_17230 [Kiritimatiellae bacterium]|nr:hypothetical protein [Kiritimatiellia bacterium]
MTVSAREKAMAAITLMAVLYGVLGLSLRGRVEKMRELRAVHREQKELMAQRDALIAQRADWEQQYNGLKDLMPVFEPGRRVDTYWLAIMDRLAAKNNFSIVKRQIGAEQPAGDVFEMPIECKDWEGSLDALVGFLYDMQSEGAMLDVRQMYIRPAPNKPALLRGSFKLHCAYMRAETAAPETADKEGKP